MNKLVAVLTLLALAGCSQSDRFPGKSSTSTMAPKAQAMRPVPAFGLVTADANAGTAYEARIRQQRTFADLPDRGELLSYAKDGDGRRARIDGAYTWRRVRVSKEHARRAIASGNLRLMTPSGQILNIRYDRHIEHPSGDLSWIGHAEDQPGAQTILTFGADAVYGSIGQPGKRSLRLTTRHGAGWIVETDPSKLVGAASAAVNPRKPDALGIPKARAKFADAPLLQPQASMKTATATAAATIPIDILVGYTQGFSSEQGGASGAVTRLNYLVTVSNEAFSNSQVNARIRLVHSMQVTYTDASTNENALEQLTGYDSDSETYTTPNAAFTALRTARETYGADLVVLVRAFRDPEQDGCGIAWLIGGGRSGISPGDGQDYFGYSVASDGSDRNEADGHTYFCRDETLVHELGHNMGSQHNRGAARGEDGILDPDEYGAFTYSFGYKTSLSGGNLYTIMSYGDPGQVDYRVFSNPRITFCGGRVCGTTAYEDNARSLSQLAPAIATFRSGSSGTARNDVDGDGRTDLLFHYPSSAPGKLQYWIMNGTQRERYSTSQISSGYLPAATGDFNGDGNGDLMWTNSARIMSMWIGNGSTFQPNILGSYGAGWSLVGAGDVNGDGRSDILFHNTTTSPAKLQYWIMNGTARLRYATFLVSSGYKLSAIGDFDGNGMADFVWTNSARNMTMWLSNGNDFRIYVLGTFGAGWSLIGAGDVDGDGQSDLLFHNATTNPGKLQYWIMNGPTRERFATSAITAGYGVSSTGDFNGDGRLDVLWSNSGRTMSMWLGDGSSFSYHVIGTHGAGWQIVK